MDENRQKLEKYESNLQKVQDLLKINENDDNLKKLKTELVKGIELVKSLISTSEEDNINTTTYMYDSLEDENEMNQAENDTDIAKKTDEVKYIDEDLLLKNKKEHNKFLASLKVHGRVLVKDSLDSSENKMMAAVIDTIYDDDLTKETMLEMRIILTGQKLTLAISSKRICPLKAKKGSILSNLSSVKIGKLVLAKFTEDGGWYRGKIVEVHKEGAIVKYLDYETKEKLPYEHIVELSEEAIESEQNKVQDLRQNIPDHLRLLPTDSDFVKLKKRKKLKAIRKRSKDVVADHVSEKRRQGWQQFQQRNQKKRRGLNLNQDSIFKVSETEVNGKKVLLGKVGVINSGRGMTKFIDTRKKHEFSQRKSKK